MDADGTGEGPRLPQAKKEGNQSDSEAPLSPRSVHDKADGSTIGEEGSTYKLVCFVRTASDRFHDGKQTC